MPTKITIIDDNPTDPTAFESGYTDQVELAKKLPGLQKIETSKCWPKEDGSPTPLYRMVDLYFADYDTASAAVTPLRRRRCSRASSGWPPVVYESRSRISKNPDSMCHC